MNIHSFTPRRSEWLEAGLLALVLFCLYAITAPRSIALEDDGLFILSSYFLGIEHPPGYPLHTVLGKLFTYLPVGSVAYRVHLLSGVLGGLSCAALWMCARVLMPGRLPAYVAALGLGFSSVFWSQAIIAEVYTLNTLFFFSLVYLGLRLMPPGTDVAVVPQATRRLAILALLFGFSLANHWPLMLLVAPGFAVLLFPLLRKKLAALPLFVVMVAIGLLPYVWLVLLSWSGLIISFYGPLESWNEFWYFVSRQGYANVDTSPATNWLDHLSYFRFIGQVVLLQFAVIGAAIAAIGFWQQWRAWGARVSTFFTLAFVMPSFALTLLLGFEYDALHKHMFHVYPLPAYGVVALWMGLGASWGIERMRLASRPAMAMAAGLLALVFAVGFRANMHADSGWAARYADTVLKTLPPDAIVFTRGEADLGPIGYFHMIEGRRPDITLYQPQGLVLGNRLFHILRDSTQTMRDRMVELVERDSRPVVFTQGHLEGFARRDHWLFREVDKSSPDKSRVTVDIPEEMVRFFEESVLNVAEDNAWVAYLQGEYRRMYAGLMVSNLARGAVPDERTQRDIEALSHDFYGALGLVEGLLANKRGYSVTQALRYLEAARDVMPSDTGKQHKARIFELGAYLRLERGDRAGALKDLEMSTKLWPVTDNPATAVLDKLYAEARDQPSRQAMWARIKR
jgi:transmembrane protein TMEM260 (protein O-mannosyltransferase)